MTHAKSTSCPVTPGLDSGARCPMSLGWRLPGQAQQ
jgi:hypothetical protein